MKEIEIKEEIGKSSMCNMKYPNLLLEHINKSKVNFDEKLILDLKDFVSDYEKRVVPIIKQQNYLLHVKKNFFFFLICFIFIFKNFLIRMIFMMKIPLSLMKEK